LENLNLKEVLLEFIDTFDFKSSQDFLLSLASVRAFIMVRKAGKLLLVLASLFGKRGVKPKRRTICPDSYYVLGTIGCC
jgi:hypothetical protein